MSNGHNLLCQLALSCVLPQCLPSHLMDPDMIPTYVLLPHAPRCLKKGADSCHGPVQAAEFSSSSQLSAPAAAAALSQAIQGAAVRGPMLEPATARK